MAERSRAESASPPRIGAWRLHRGSVTIAPVAAATHAPGGRVHTRTIRATTIVGRDLGPHTPDPERHQGERRRGDQAEGADEGVEHPPRPDLLAPGVDRHPRREAHRRGDHRHAGDVGRAGRPAGRGRPGRRSRDPPPPDSCEIRCRRYRVGPSTHGQLCSSRLAAVGSRREEYSATCDGPRRRAGQPAGGAIGCGAQSSSYSAMTMSAGSMEQAGHCGSRSIL